MIWMVVLALGNGLLIGLCRAINGRLSQSKGAFSASFYNHLVGALLLVFMITLFGYLNVAETLNWGEIIMMDWQHIPIMSYLGGVIGALYVAINSHVLTRIGALKTALLVISGQMVTGVMFDVVGQPFLDSIIQLVGVILIIAGVYCGQTGSKAR
ncbi:MAG: DMT family transporter [Aliivibrio sp.]|uniref:DMT family transporter n=1 Tax=Aliivibrio sp. TaxID=1872443 RepID=UPI001A499485|nr:DMT family transporter [Aliivibrio sp.]